MGKLEIVDSHVHLYDPKDGIHDWVAGVPTLNRAYLPADFSEASREVDVTDFIFVEVDASPGNNIKEIEWVADQSKTDKRIRGLVASFPLEEGDACAAAIEAYAQHPLARGVRRLIQGHVAEPGWCLQPKFVEGVKLLAGHGLSFDICIKHPQMPDAIDLVRRCPEVRFVLDHIGKPGVADGLREPWRSQMAELARLPNVWCKISGVITEANHSSWSEADVRPYICDAIDAFGFERIMFGGDWPVVNLATTYAHWVDILRSVVGSASQEEQARFWRETARAFYRI